MKFAVTILGSGSAKPTTERLTSAHVLNVHEHLYLIDCGEGAQISMMKYQIPMSKINHVFISHLHGDHYFGLIGLINSMHLYNRKRDLNIFCFPDLKEIINLQLNAASTTLSFKLNYHFLSNEKPQTIHNDKHVTVTSFPLKHRIPTCGFLFQEKKRARNIRKEFTEQHNIPVEWYLRILAGEDFIDEKGTRYSNDSIIRIPAVSRSYAYCSDTAYEDSIIPLIQNVSLLYHEASFADDQSENAERKFHSTARQAAMIAKQSGAGRLIIGHFSSRYRDVSPLISEAREIFKNSIEAYDGLCEEL